MHGVQQSLPNETGERRSEVESNPMALTEGGKRHGKPS
jgi:hypothetical protein